MMNHDVLVVLPPAIPLLEVLSITPLGDPNVNATITLPDGTTHPVKNYYPSASAKTSADEADQRDQHDQRNPLRSGSSW